MMNTLKILTNTKECRIVVTDTQSLSETLLATFYGNQTVRHFLEEILTVAVLFGGIHDFYTKISFLYRLNKKNILCEIKENNVSLRYPNELNDKDFCLESLLVNPGIVSITIGDWSIGLHTGTVAFEKKRPSEVMTYFSLQSEQLLSEFMVSKEQPTKGILLQGLPFVETRALQKVRDLIIHRQTDSLRKWQEDSKQFGQILWQKKVGSYGEILEN
ncbi:hypothetical protein DOK78_000216 [Enterococcus sp. DIV2402]|uniref:Uncharacterized protein n=2 Tax=Candidatus Enterococcus lowellii TaxID=2230877 RepID=A0ABZ2SJH6_9ENTE|nr:Hsp33 family molecular chaperone HslO [Enterococcus sp. DIV2402]